MTTVIQSRPPFTRFNYAIVRNADWADQFPAIMDGDGYIDASLFDRTYRLLIRPQFDSTILIAQYTNVPNFGETGIHIDPDDHKHTPYIFVPQATVASTFVTGTYDMFFMLEELEAYLIPRKTELWRGKLYVHPGKV